MSEALFEKKPLSEKLRILFWLVIIAGLALVVLILVRGEKLVIRPGAAYQAVFLDNGQVYFGKLKSLNRDFLSLTDIYYLRAGTVQRGEESGGQVDLIKLGAELHAPRDEMIINKEHVLFYEDISETSEVVKLIRKHKQGK